MRLQFLAITCLTWIVMGCWTICSAEAGEKGNIRTQYFIDVPQEFVVCTGWQPSVLHPSTAKWM
jgi:hypothetical protein